MPNKDEGDDKKSTKDVVNKKQKQMLNQEDYLPEEGYDVARDEGRVKSSKDKKDGTKMPPSEEVKKTQKKNDGPSAYERVKGKYKGQIMDVKEEEYVPEGNMQDAAINTINKAATFVQTSENPAVKVIRKVFKVNGGKDTITKDEYQKKINTKTKIESHYDWRSTLDEKCWAGYEKKGMKTMFGKRYPNCVKKSKKKK
jgi:hypothetical protein